MWWVEVIGYAGMVLVLASFLMKKVFWIRVVNNVACVVTVAYGILINSWPTICLNTILFFVNIYFLIKLKK